MLPRLKLLAALLLFGAAVSLGLLWHKAQEAMHQGEMSAVHSGELPFSYAPWQSASSSFTPVNLLSGSNASAGFNGDVYRLNPAALTNSTQSWVVGRDLPAAPLLSLAVRTGSGNPELWIATGGAGILIYDGHFFRQLLPGDGRLRKISALLPLRNGQVLAGTPDAGLYVTDGKVLRLFHSVFRDTQITALAGDEDEFWAGTRADGVWYWKGGGAVHFSKELPDPQVLSLAANGSTAWVGTALGVTEFMDGRFRRQLAPGLFARAVAQKDGALRVATLDQGTRTVLLDARAPRPQRVAQAADEPAPVSAQHVTALHHDARGNLWIGYFDRGLDIVSDRGAVDHREDDRLFCVNRIREHNGAIAVATANGLAFFDESTKLRRVLDRNSGLIASNVTDVLFDRDATVVATPAGLSFVDRGVSSLYAFQGLVNNHVYTLAEWDGTLYAGTLGGLSTVRNGLVQASFTTANSDLRQNWITAAEVFAGKLFVGTYGAGVVELSKSGGVTAFPAFAKIRTEVNPNALLATNRALYAGTAGRGLAILPAGEQRWRFVTEGLPSLNITALESFKGELYIGTDNGLVQTAEEKLL